VTAFCEESDECGSVKTETLTKLTMNCWDDPIPWIHATLM
jgi:hypothetical protein